MSVNKPMFKPRFTPIPPDIDIPHLVRSTPNFQWSHREDARLHSAPFHKLNHVIHAVTIQQGLPIVVDNWHLRNDWNPALFSSEWLDREHGGNGISALYRVLISRYHCEGLGEGTGYINVDVELSLTGADFGWSGF
jgi:hypothetical protein